MSGESPSGACHAASATAVDGYAYGIIGADICVFGDAVPVYVREKRAAVAEAVPAVDMLRVLARQHPDTHCGDLAGALATLAERHASLFRFRKGAAAAKESAALAGKLR
jgi:hypothetical protein